MRQFLSLRFWLTFGALAGLFLVFVLVFGRSAPPTGVQASSDDKPTEPRHLDLVQWVFLANPAPGFALDRGVTTADLSLQLDGTRTMVIKAGTPGEISCPTLTSTATCTVAADLLGDAVLWFSLVPGTPGASIVLPAVTETLDGGWVRLANGWGVRRASAVERSCAEDTSSLGDFVRTYGDSATATFNFEQQQVVKVTCPREGATTSTSTSPAADGSVPSGSVIVGGEGDDDPTATPPTT
ncbi:MAG: hypothetical protein ACOYMR_03235 [Ilumatobacteraceae bacterium]